jgi:hypothetical protein
MLATGQVGLGAEPCDEIVDRGRIGSGGYSGEHAELLEQKFTYLAGSQTNFFPLGVKRPGRNSQRPWRKEKYTWG